MSIPQQTVPQNENPLQIGISTLSEIEARLRAFRVMNRTSIKKRYLVSREDLSSAQGDHILKKGSGIDISAIKLLRRYYPADKTVKIFQPDEGIAIISDMSTPQGISFSMDLVTQVVNISGGAYEGFIERVSSLGEFLNLLKRSLFPRLVIIGYLPQQRLETEKINYLRSRKVDRYIRLIEVTHSIYKKESLFVNDKNVHIDPNDRRAWGRLILEIMNVYTKPYSQGE